MQIELRCNTLVRDFKKYKRSYENISEMRLPVAYMNLNTLIRFMKQLSRINKWGENALSPEAVAKAIMDRVHMDVDGTRIKYSPDVPDNCMRI